MKPRLLDLFCRAGGATKGYQRAGFYVVGVDIDPQPDFCGDEFYKADALTFPLHSFDAIHASPTCQLFTRARHLRDAQGNQTGAVDLIEPIRARLRPLGIPYVIENVPGAPLHGVTLCGSSFGLKVRRHRVFESNVYIPPLPCDHRTQGRPVGVYHVLNDNIPHGGKTAETLEEGQEAMGIDWMEWADLTQAIPPAFTEHVGACLLAALTGGSDAV